MTTDLNEELTIPRKFYKYRALDSETSFSRAMEIILESKIYFPSPSMFNDPFDCRPAFDFSASKKTIKKDFQRLQLKYGPQLNRAARRSESNDLFRDKTRDPRQRLVQNQIQDEYNAEMNKVGVLCVAEKNDDILMWSHYADSHRGICIEFDGYNQFMAHAQEVKYTEQRPSISQFTRTDKQTNLEKAMLTKSSHWAYEKEWRLIRYEKGHGIVQFRPENLTGIIFGVQTPDKTIERIRTLLEPRQEPIAFYRAQLTRDTFNINIKPMA